MLKSTLEGDQHLAPAADEVGVAVVGLGYWGPNLLRVLGDNVDARVRWICDLDPERLGKYRRRYPDARVTTRLERVLADPTVDAVIIATPVDTHYDLAGRRCRRRAAERGRTCARGREARVCREAAGCV